jgi:hypothetical protein
MEGVGQDITSKVSGSGGTEVSLAKPGGEAIRLVVAIHRVARALRQLNVELDPEDCESLDAVRVQASKVEVELDSDKTNLLATISEGPNHHGQENSRVVCIAGVIHLCTCVPATLWNNRIVRCTKLHQLRQKWWVQLPRTPSTIVLRLS